MRVIDHKVRQKHVSLVQVCSRCKIQADEIQLEVSISNRRLLSACSFLFRFVSKVFLAFLSDLRRYISIFWTRYEFYPSKQKEILPSPLLFFSMVLQWDQTPSYRPSSTKFEPIIAIKSHFSVFRHQNLNVFGRGRYLNGINLESGNKDATGRTATGATVGIL